MAKEKLLHLHLSDSMGNLKTLICSYDDNGIQYSLYGGIGSSGTPFAVSNIQFYTIIDGNIKWLKYASLPIDTKLGETKEEFKERVIKMLNNSTDKVVKVVQKPQFA
tara:strand:+ start:431 stop:751 length:321 start_codon:yes stop_codon:yes gene_type:complete